MKGKKRGLHTGSNRNRRSVRGRSNARGRFPLKDTKEPLFVSFTCESRPETGPVFFAALGGIMLGSAVTFAMLVWG